MTIHSTYRVEFLYFALSIIAVYGVYKDSESIWVTIIFFIILSVMGAVYAYIFRVKSIEIHDKKIVFNKLGRSTYIEKGDIRRIWRLSSGNGVFHIWFTNGTKDIFVPPLAYKNLDLNIIETHLRKLIVL